MPPPPPTLAARPGYRPAIDGLRAVAILMVVGYHVGLPGFGGGFVGVDVFFALSGFLIIGLLAREYNQAGRLDWVAFFARRARRLVPAALTMTVVVLALGLVSLDAINERQDLAKSALAAIGFGANVYFWKVQPTGYFGAGAAPPPLLHTWSLSAEEQFYFAAPLLLLALGSLARTGRVPVRRLLLIVLVSGSALSLAAAVWAAGPHPTPAFYLPVTRAYEFGIGGLLSQVRWLPGRRVSQCAGVAGIAALVAVTVWSLPDVGFPSAWALVPVVATCLVIGAGDGQAAPGAVTRILGARPMVHLGKLSYGWYLYHFPFLALATAWNIAPPALGWQLVVVVIALGAAELSYRYVEVPLRHRRYPHAGSWRVLGAGVLVSALTCGVALGYGLVARMARDREPWAAMVAAVNDFPSLGQQCVEANNVIGILEARCEVTPFDPSRPTIVLWGDSHAWHLVDGLRVAAEESGVNLVAWTLGGCPPYEPASAPPVSIPRSRQRALDDCDEQNRRAVKDIEGIEDGPSTVRVVMSARWDLYLGADPAGRADSVALDGIALPQSYTHRLEDGTPLALAELAGAGIDAELVGASPELARPAPLCVLTPRRPFSCNISVRDLDQVEPFSPAFLSKAAAATKPPSVILDPRAWLCTSTVCPARWSGGFNYFDDDHLSGTRSRSLAPKWLPTMQRLLAQPTG